MISGVEISVNPDGTWSVYLVREDGMQMAAAYSVNHPGTSAESMAHAWRSFLGLVEPPAEVI